MKVEAQALWQESKQALALQCMASVLLLLVVAVWLALATREQDVAQAGALWSSFGAALYGSLLALAGTLLSARSVMRGFGRGAERTERSALGPIYVGLLNKLVIIGGGIACGLIYQGFHPAWVVTGYLVAQIAGAGVMLRQKPGPLKRYGPDST